MSNALKASKASNLLVMRVQLYFPSSRHLPTPRQTVRYVCSDHEDEARVQKLLKSQHNQVGVILHPSFVTKEDLVDGMIPRHGILAEMSVRAKTKGDVILHGLHPFRVLELIDMDTALVDVSAWDLGGASDLRDCIGPRRPRVT